MLYLDGQLRFHSWDEHRLQEALGVVPALFRTPGTLRDVLVLGGGEGLLARTLLRFPEVRRIVLCERDPYLVEIASRPPLADLNEGSLRSPRVEVALGDPLEWLASGRGAREGPFDLAICDLPPPRDPALDRFYSADLYRAARARLRPDGLLVAASPWLPSTYSVVHHTLRGVFSRVYPYRAPVLTLGTAGFHLASDAPLRRARGVPGWARWLNEPTAAALFSLAKDELHYLAYSGSTSALDGWRIDLRLPEPGEEAIEEEEEDEDEDEEEDEGDAP